MKPTMYTSSNMPLTWRHWWICFVASLGQLVGTAVATIAGIIIPMLLITSHGELSSGVQGLIGAADLLGIVVGSIVFGNLSDRFGYLLFFRLCPALILVFSILAIFVPNVPVLVLSLFMIGLGIGGEYSLDSDYVSVLMPDKWKKLMLGLVKTGAAFGNIGAAGLCLWLVMREDNAGSWPVLMWIVAGIAAVMLLTRIYFFESPKWLLDHGKRSQAEAALHKFLGDDVEMDDSMPAESTRRVKAKSQSVGFVEFCRQNRDRVMLTGVPWACEGLGVYGIGVFIPILVMTLGIEHLSATATPIDRVAESVKTTLWISCIILPGFLLGILLTYKKFKETRLQVLNFWACTVSLLVLMLAYMFKWPTWISLVAFMAFELFLNIGPHLVTYLLPPKVYPVEIRGQGTGIAASLGKVGAVMGVFLIPVLLKLGGGVLVLAVSAAVMAIGAGVTSYYGSKVATLSDDQ